MDIKELAAGIALNTFLSEYNKEKDPTNVLDAIARAESWDDKELQDLEVSVWEPFEGNYPSQVAEYISNLAEEIENGYKSLAKS
jgi:Golgi nucleoside diphosphatase